MIYEFKEDGVWFPGYGIKIEKEKFREIVDDMPDAWED